MKTGFGLICLMLLILHGGSGHAAEKSIKATNRILSNHPFSYEVSLTAPVDTFIVLEDRSFGVPLELLQGQTVHSTTGTLLLILSSVEHAYFKEGRLMRYLYMRDPQKPQRALPSVEFRLAAQIGQKAFMHYFEPDHFSSLPDSSTPFVIETIDGNKFGVTYDAATKTYAFTVGKSE
ncbi:hypothetical protein [Fundidesulfovibrio putealis]|uniref:hypothetical protein n=1 Tax=Fundidesulfovibrio putealis TaxID=270496 RepID=UPI0004111446|nr:hypothetical protein [Fundidesulfovibrio putealis]KAF0234925.1 MAG: hypothetical protein FD177_488 [Desulfovibrionaceae bacterium]